MIRTILLIVCLVVAVSISSIGQPRKVVASGTVHATEQLTVSIGNRGGLNGPGVKKKFRQKKKHRKAWY